MKFDKLVQNIAETLYSPDIETETNQAFQDWKANNPKLAATPSAYFHFKKNRTDDTYGSSSKPIPSVTTGEPTVTPAGSISSRKGSRADFATKERINSILSVEPEASEEAIIDRITADAETGDNVNADPAFIKKEIDAWRTGQSAVTSKEEPDFGGEVEKRLKAHAAIRAAMARRNMKLGDPATLLRRKEREDTEEESDDEESGQEKQGSDVDYIKNMVQSMKSKDDEEEEFSEPKD